MDNLDKENRLKELDERLKAPVKRHLWSSFDLQNLRESEKISQELFLEKNPNYNGRDLCRFINALSNESKD